MKKQHGFSLTEILMLIFAIAIVAAIIFPMKIIDIHQAERIAAWKSCYQKLLYSFDIMKIKDEKLLNEIISDDYSNSSILFDLYTNYLKVDTEKTKNTNFSNYKLRFLNRKKILKNSEYNPEKYIVLKDGEILSFASFKRTANNTKNSPLGAIFVDINGKQNKNSIGRDVFILLLYQDKIEPYGENSSVQEMKEDCSPIGSGMKCSAYYLVGGSF